MILFRSDDGRLFVRYAGDQFFYDRKGEKFYCDINGHPVDSSGNTVSGELVTKHVYTFEEYVAAFPEGERFRRWLTSGTQKLMLVQTSPWHSCMPGSVYNVSLYTKFDHPKYPTPARVVINDGDDGYMRKEFTSDLEASRGFDELLMMAPFVMNDLTCFGYNMG